MNIKDIPDTLNEFIEWSLVRINLCCSFSSLRGAVGRPTNKRKMVPTPTNRDVVGYNMAELLHSVPSAFGIKAFASRITI